MDLYQADHSGVQVPNDQLTSQVFASAKLRGYFSREDISRLLNQNGCVGLRIYNACRPDGSASRLVAAGVRADGFDLSASYLRGQDTDAPDLGRATQTLNRAAARQMVLDSKAGFANLKNQFSAFFSTRMLVSLLADSTFGGLAFYEVNAGDFADGLLDGTPIGRGFHSFMALPARLDNGRIAAGQGNAAPATLSDLPCPGHCISFRTGGVSEIQTFGRALSEVDSNFAQSGDPYLISWDEQLAS